MARSENMQAKAERLINDGRMHEITSQPGRMWTGVADGDTGRYLVTAVNGEAIRELRLGTGPVPPAESCTCKGHATSGKCSHVYAAQTLVRRSMPIEDLFARVA